MLLDNACINNFTQHISNDPCDRVLGLTAFGAATILFLLTGLIFFSLCCLACRIRRLERTIWRANSSNKGAGHVENQRCVGACNHLVEVKESVDMAGEMVDGAGHVEDQSCVGASYHLVMREMKQTVDMAGEMENGAGHVEDQSCVGASDHLIMSEVQQSVGMAEEMEEGAGHVEDQSCVGASDHLVMSEVQQSVGMAEKMEKGIYDSIILKTDPNNDEADIPSYYDIIREVGNSNGEEVVYINLTGIFDQQDGGKGKDSVEKKEKQQEYSVIKKGTKRNVEYNLPMHFAESLSSLKNADTPRIASATFPHEYHSIEKATPSSLQVREATNLAQSGSGSSLPPPPLPPPIHQKDLPGGMLGLEKEVTRDVTKRESCYCNIGEVKAEVSALTDPVDKYQRNGRKSLIYMNVNVV